MLFLDTFFISSSELTINEVLSVDEIFHDQIIINVVGYKQFLIVEAVY